MLIRKTFQYSLLKNFNITHSVCQARRKWLTQTKLILNYDQKQRAEGISCS